MKVTFELGMKVARLAVLMALADSTVVPAGGVPTTSAGRAPAVVVLLQATKLEQGWLKPYTTLKAGLLGPFHANRRTCSTKHALVSVRTTVTFKLQANFAHGTIRKQWTYPSLCWGNLPGDEVEAHWSVASCGKTVGHSLGLCHTVNSCSTLQRLS